MDVSGELAANGLKIHRKILVNKPADRIIEYAQETPGAVVVMTTHGRSGLIRLAVGSVSEAVVRSSGSPMLIVSQSSTREMEPRYVR